MIANPYLGQGVTYTDAAGAQHAAIVTAVYGNGSGVALRVLHDRDGGSDVLQNIPLSKISAETSAADTALATLATAGAAISTITNSATGTQIATAVNALIAAITAA
jgi:hypothetical protein